MNLFANLLILFFGMLQNTELAETYFKKELENSQTKKYEQAIIDFTKAISLKSNYSEAFYNRGIVYFEMKQPDKGFADFDKAIRLNAENGMFWFQRGNRKWLALDKEGACLDWQQAQNLDFPLAHEIIKTKCIKKLSE